MKDSAELRNELAAMAAQQSGYFTAAQARAVGYDYPQHTFHTARGNWERVARGLYRLPHWPTDRHDDLVRASLWARGLGVVSHESAAAFHELGEIDPLRTHLTVPARFRALHHGIILHHRSDLAAADISDQGAFRVTTPLRTLIDVARSATDIDQLARAVEEARRRRLVTLADLRRQARATGAEAALAIEDALVGERGS